MLFFYPSVYIQYTFAITIAIVVSFAPAHATGTLSTSRGRHIKKITLAITLAAFATTASAGGLQEPEVTMAPAPMIEEATAGSSAGNLIVPLLAVLLLAAAAR